MKPQLLLPAGNPEAFHAALEGGADAVYLGLRQFNARGKARNFTPSQLQSLLKEAEKNSLKVFLTLNTLIRNPELPQLLDLLHLISQTSLSAVIIQDLGVLYLLKKYFKTIPVFASTQLSVHNSTGTEYLYRKGFDRVILARELTFPELKRIARRCRIDLEFFAHGALCYSISGMCLFSSYLGGMSANRGLCCQPCRRKYKVNEKREYIFNLRDLELIEIIPDLMKLAIKSVKIEGRMKSAEYVYLTARAYRMFIDDPDSLPAARELLASDLGRKKTGYFIGGSVKNSFADVPFIGTEIGIIENISGDLVSFITDKKLNYMDRLRILPASGVNSRAFKLKEFKVNGIPSKQAKKGDRIELSVPENLYRTGDRVILTGIRIGRFKSSFQLQGRKISYRLSEQRKKNILNRTGSKKTGSRDELYLRIDCLKWLRKINFEKFDFLILNLTRKEWQEFGYRDKFIKKNQYRIFIELPRIIWESDLDFYRKLCFSFHKEGFNNFFIGHISQLLLLPQSKKVRTGTDEAVYCLNDAAIQFIKEENISRYISPLENDHENLISGKDRKMIVPLYFKPPLFHARMPIHSGTDIIEGDDISCRKLVREGMTIIVPEIPVCLIQARYKLSKKGFSRYLIDFSYHKPSKHTFYRIIDAYAHSRPVNPSTIFNFKSGLK